MDRLDALRPLAHTGDDRCRPCTVVNVAIVAIAALLLGRRRRGAGLAVAAVGLLVVWLRGYVVPFTPRFAPALVAASPVPDEWFGHERAPAPGPTEGLGDDVDGEELLKRLVEAGVLTADGEAVDLAPDFAAAWEAEMERLAALSTEALADATFDVARAADASVVDGTRREWIVLGDGSGDVDAQTWLSRPVAVAETAAATTLAGWLSDPTIRRAAAGPLRVFLSECPDCGTALVESSTMACCGGTTTPREEPDDVLACPDCDARLHTFE